MADCSIAHCCGGCCVLVRTSSQFCSALGGETRRDIMCMCKQTQLTWMRSETGLTLMNLPIKRACKAPRGKHHYHVWEMQRTRVRLWKRVFSGLWRPFSMLLSIFQSDSKLGVFCYGARTHAVFLRLEKDILPPAWGIMDVWPQPVGCLVLLWVWFLAENMLWNQPCRLKAIICFWGNIMRQNASRLVCFPDIPWPFQICTELRENPTCLSTILLGQSSIFRVVLCIWLPWQPSRVYCII